MPNIMEGYISSKILQTLMILIGMKRGRTKREQLLIHALLLYVITSILIAIFVELTDLFDSRNDLHALTYSAPCALTVIFDFLKLMIFTYKRQKVQELNQFDYDTFWNKEYNELDTKILDKCDTTSAIGMSIMSAMSSSIAIHYLVGPYLDAIGTNSTERVLPFRVAFDLPLTVTPYYEIMYGIEIIAACSVAVCSITFASYLYYTCIFISGQFKILQRELETVCDIQVRNSMTKTSNNNDVDQPPYEKFKKCVKKHKLLIWYIDQLEGLFSYILLTLVLCIVIMLCFPGFQVIVGTQVITLHRQILSVEFCVASVVLLVLFSFSCNEILEASAAIAEATYRCKWYNLPCDEDGRAVRQGLTIMVMRSYKPCVLTVGKFCPMTLQVFTSVLSTALSYLTVLREKSENK